MAIEKTSGCNKMTCGAGLHSPIVCAVSGWTCACSVLVLPAPRPNRHRVTVCSDAALFSPCASNPAPGCPELSCGGCAGFPGLPAGNCGAFFCWRCNRLVSGYDHFGTGSCVLFEQAEINAWERQQGYMAIVSRTKPRAVFLKVLSVIIF